MASNLSLPPIAIISLLLLLISQSPTTLSQEPGSSPPGLTAADCTSRLLPLATCAPFVQGSVQTPAQPCCDNLKQLYIQQPGCLCLLLNDPTISSLPINTTLALQLPVVCRLQVNISTCSGSPAGVPPVPPNSQVSFGAKPNSTVAASPMVTVAPRPSITGFRFGQSASIQLRPRGHSAMVAITTTAFLLTKVLCRFQ